MINMLGLAKKMPARILQASTSEIYGDPEVHPQSEDYVGHVNTLGPRACYDEGKRVAETLCMDYHRGNGVDIRLVRIFNTYGPRMHPDDGRVISNFITQALQNQSITLYGDGSQTRSFCYVDDLIVAMIRTMDQTATLGPINIGNPEEITIKKLAELVIAATQSKSTITYHELPTDDPKQRRPDINRAKKYLDWEPTVSFASGLPKTINYFRSLSN
jgi:UDP-glucuronate decarboxylase